MELTKEYFDEIVGGLANKADLAAQTADLKAYVMEAFEIQQVWIDERFKELIVPYDVCRRVARLEANSK